MIVSEEAIAKGIRRIVAVTGAEAQKVSTSGWFVAYSWLVRGLQGRKSPVCELGSWFCSCCIQNWKYNATPQMSSGYSYLAEESHHHTRLPSYVVFDL